MQRHTISWVLPLAVISLVIAMPNARAAVYTYEIVSLPGLQNSAGLTGNIIINTAGGDETPTGSGDYYLSHAAITAWNFTVSPTVGGDYSGSSNGVNPEADGLGGAYALFATPTTLSILVGASLKLQSGQLPNPQQLDWNLQTDSALYIASSGGATWLETDKALLDSSFSSYAIPGDINNWVIATAVPEPSVTLMSLLGALFLMRRRR